MSDETFAPFAWGGQETIHAKIEELRDKYRRADGTVDMSDDSPLHHDLAAWLKVYYRETPRDWGRESWDEFERYFEEHQLPTRWDGETVFDPDALLALGGGRYIRAGKAKKKHLEQHLEYLQQKLHDALQN